jgi:hypothetical protein
VIVWSVTPAQFVSANVLHSPPLLGKIRERLRHLHVLGASIRYHANATARSCLAARSDRRIWYRAKKRRVGIDANTDVPRYDFGRCHVLLYVGRLN